MEEKIKNSVVAVRFSKIGKLYYFESSPEMGIEIGDNVVVETSRGWQLGEAVQFLGDSQQDGESSWKKIDRKATDEDLKKKDANSQLENQLLEISRREINHQKIETLKIVLVELSLDASKITVLYSYEHENKLDLRNVKFEILKLVPKAQVDFRRIGNRDVAKIFGGMGTCGLPIRCCSKFLTDFSSISIRMAKEQGISLTPDEITGMCDRLKCCLIYEYEMYSENRKLLPKRNKRVMTPVGEGKVKEVLPLKMAVLVDIPNVGRKEFFNADIRILDGLEQVVEIKEEDDQNDDQQNSDEVSLSSKPEISDRNTLEETQNKASQKSKKRSRWKKRRQPARGKSNENQQTD